LRVSQDRKLDYGIAKEEKEVCVDQKCAEAFRRLKELLTTTPTLKLPGMIEGFLVCTDASK
jgi:hypothetical protein